MSALDLPGTPDMEWQGAAEQHDPDDEAVALPDDGENRDDESPYTKTYVAIDGLDSDKLTEEQADALEKEITNLLLLDFEFPVTGVRVIADKDTGYVVEFDGE